MTQQPVHKLAPLPHSHTRQDNFAMGLGQESSVVHRLDFGLAALYRDKDSNKHFDFAIGSKFRGTVRYASINGHTGIRQSRRDDLESLGYIFVYFLKGESLRILRDCR